MKSRYLRENGLRLFVAFAIVLGVCFGLVDPAAALVGGLVLDTGPGDLKALEEAMKKAFATMQENIKKVQDTANQALEEVKAEGTLHKKTSDELKKLGETGNLLAENYNELKQRTQDLEQWKAKKPGAGAGDEPGKTAGQIIAESEQYAAMIKSREWKMAPVVIERKTIVNAPGQNQPLVMTDRQVGIVMPGLKRLTVRDLIPQMRTTSNMIEYVRELVFTNNAGPQYSAESPGPITEGAAKPESGITFELVTAAVITIAHWLAASRQILSDATQLQGYIDTRLSFGLKLEEEDELLNSTGTSGELNGLVNQATAFSGGVTNQTALDTLLKAMLQVSLSFYETSGIVLHPTDWTNIMLLKDTTGRYLFSDQHSVEQPRVWGKPVVPTPSQVAGTFLLGAFDLAAAIFDREDINIRVSDQHADFFVKNLVAILCEERLALAVYRPSAIVKGSISYAG